MEFIIVIVIVFLFLGLLPLIGSIVVALIPVVCLVMMYYYFTGIMQDKKKLYSVYCVNVDNWQESKLVSGEKIILNLKNDTEIIFENSEHKYVMNNLIFLYKKELNNGDWLIKLYFQDEENYKIIKISIKVYGNSLSTKIYNRLKIIGKKEPFYEKIEISELIRESEKNVLRAKEKYVSKCVETRGIIANINAGEIELITDKFENHKVIFLPEKEDKKIMNLSIGDELTVKGKISIYESKFIISQDFRDYNDRYYDF